MKCNKCGKEAVYYQKHSGMNFCKECFISDVMKKVRKTLGKDIIKQNIKIGIGISGGKDSLVMVHILNEFFKPIPNSKIIAFMVDEGIEGFRRDGIEAGIKFCEEHGIEYKIATFEEYLGTNLDEMVKIAKEKNLTMNPCSFCGVIRRKILNRMALEEKCDYLAIGHNLDDISHAVMMNYIEGNIKKLVLLGKNAEHPQFVKRIKPLKKIPEDEVLLFADLMELKYHKSPCPYSSISYRAEVSDIVDELEEKHPGAKYSIVAGFERLIEHLDIDHNTTVCKYCKEPSASGVCKVCTFLDNLDLLENSKFTQ